MSGEREAANKSTWQNVSKCAIYLIFNTHTHSDPTLFHWIFSAHSEKICFKFSIKGSYADIAKYQEFGRTKFKFLFKNKFLIFSIKYLLNIIFAPTNNPINYLILSR